MVSAGREWGYTISGEMIEDLSSSNRIKPDDRESLISVFGQHHNTVSFGHVATGRQLPADDRQSKDQQSAVLACSINLVSEPDEAVPMNCRRGEGYGAFDSYLKDLIWWT